MKFEFFLTVFIGHHILSEIGYDFNVIRNDLLILWISVKRANIEPLLGFEFFNFIMRQKRAGLK